MISVTAAAILVYKLWIPEGIKSFIYENFIAIVFVFCAVMLCVLILPAGIKMLRQAKNSEVNVGPLTPGTIKDIISILDEDQDKMGFQYVVSFVNDNGVRSLGFTQIFYGEQKYHKGDAVNLRDIAKQKKSPGVSTESHPSYDVDLWDDQSAADERQVSRVFGWIMVGMTAFWVLAALIAVCIRLLF